MRTLAALLPLLALPFVAKADATDDLLRLVPAEATVCFVVQDLRGHAARVTASPFLNVAQSSAWAKSLAASDDWKALDAKQRIIAETLGMKPADLRDDVFGDVVIYAYLPGPKDKPGDDGGVLLTRARKPDLLAKLAAKLNEAQRGSGEVTKVTEKSHAGAAYFRRDKPDGRADFFALDGGLLVYAATERGMTLTLDRKANAPPVAKETPYFAAARKRLGFETAAVCGMFAPRSIDAELNAVGAFLPGEAAKAFVGKFTKFWAAIEAIGLAVRLDRGAEISLGFVTDRAKLTADQAAALAPPEASAVWSAVPADALVAVAGRFKWEEVVDLVGVFMAEADRARFRKWMDGTLAPVVGRDVLPKVLTGLGPDMGGWITPPSKSDALPSATIAVKLPAGDDKLKDAIRRAIDYFAQAYRIDHNKRHDDQLTISDETVSGVKVTVVGGAVGVKPAYAVRGDYLVTASTPQAVAAVPADPTAKPADAGLMIRFSASRAASYLDSHGKALAAVAATKSGRDAAELAREFAATAAWLELFETWELRRTTAGDRTTITWRIEFVKPLK